MRVIGIDPSLQRTGIAVITDDTPAPRAETFPVVTGGRRADTIAERRERLHEITLGARGALDDASLAVIEAPAFNTPGGSTWDRAGLWWHLVDVLRRHEVPVADAAPTTRAKWATGRGDAKKRPVLEAMRALWPGLTIRTDDEADALAFAHMGAQHLGWAVPELDHQRACLSAVSWPVETAELAV